MMDFKGSQFERDIILWGVRWYVAYPISYRQLEEMMQERGVEVDHSILNRWVIKYTPVLDQVFRQTKRPVGTSWRLDETYISVKGQWKYLYRTNIVEQDQRAIKRKTRPMLGFKSFWSAAITLAGIELMHMIRKGQLKGRAKSRPAQQFYSLAA